MNKIGEFEWNIGRFSPWVIFLRRRYNNDTLSAEDGLQLSQQLLKENTDRLSAARCHHNIGYYALLLNKKSLSIKHLRIAHKMNPKSLTSVLFYANLLENCKMYTKSGKYFKKALILCQDRFNQILFPDIYYQIYFQYGLHLLLVKGNLRLAIKFFAESLDFTQSFAEENASLIYLINIYLHFNDFETALTYFKLTHMNLYFDYHAYFSAIYACFALEDYSNVQLIFNKMKECYLKMELDYDIRFHTEKMRFCILTQQYTEAAKWYLKGINFINQCKIKLDMIKKDEYRLKYTHQMNELHRDAFEMWSVCLQLETRDYVTAGKLIKLFFYRKKCSPVHVNNNSLAYAFSFVARLTETLDLPWLVVWYDRTYLLTISLHTMALGVNKHFAFGLFTFGSLCYDLKNYQLAYKLIQKAYKLNSNLPIISRNWSVINSQLERILNELNCNYCGKNTKNCNVSACKGCCSIYYCSRTCQKRGWKHGHRDNCKKQWLIVFEQMN